jgi:regulator of RNase E activity RraB
MTKKKFDFRKPPSANNNLSQRSNDNIKIEGQLQASLRVLDLLSEKKNSGNKNESKIEFFFYADTVEKAGWLSQELKKLNYEVGFDSLATYKNKLLVTGWTNEMKLTEKVVTSWMTKMYNFARKFNCEFDGWGTFAD